MTANWLITGGCGFVGRHLVRELITNQRSQIRILDNFKSSQPEDIVDITNNHFPSLKVHDTPSASFLEQEIEIVEGDICDPEKVLRCAREVDFIVHLAANTGVAPSIKDPIKDCRTNVIGTLNVLEASRFQEAKKVIFASSGAPIGAAVPPIHEDMACRPVSPYGASKLAGEAYCSAYYHSYGIESVALRFGNVYGPDSKHKASVVAKLIQEALRDENWIIYGDGNHTRDFIYVKDLVRAIILSSKIKNAGGEIFQIATNSETPIKQLLKLISEALNKNGIRSPKVIFEDERTGDVKRNFSCIDKAREQLGWTPTESLEDGLQETVKWFLDNQ